MRRRSKDRLGDFVTALPAAPPSNSQESEQTEDGGEIESWFTRYERLRHEGCRLASVKCTGAAIKSPGRRTFPPWMRRAVPAAGVAIGLAVCMIFVFASRDESSSPTADVPEIPLTADTQASEAPVGAVLPGLPGLPGDPSMELAKAVGLDAGIDTGSLDAGIDAEKPEPAVELTKKKTRADRFKRPTKRLPSLVPFNDPLVVTQDDEPPMVFSVSDDPDAVKNARYRLQIDKYKGVAIETVHRNVRVVFALEGDQ